MTTPRLYRTDAAEEAIHQARSGSYKSNRVMGVPPALLARYFEQTDESYVFRKDLRRPMIFAQRNLLQNPILKWTYWYAAIL